MDADNEMPTDPDGSASSSARPRIGLAVLVGIGGALGTALRAAIASAFPATVDQWPWAIFLVNCTGALLLGALLQALALLGSDHGARRAVRLALGTGVLGGFTTYSTLALEILQKEDAGVIGLAAAYGLGSVLVGVLAAWLGSLIAAGVIGRIRKGQAR